MKKVLMYLIMFIIIIFILPILFTQRKNIKKDKNKDIECTINSENTGLENNTNVENNVDVQYEYNKFSTIKLYHKKNEEIEELPIDEYLYGVVSSEMPADFEIEALKAQAIVARTYTIYQILNNNKKHNNADICDDFSCCQAWISKEERIQRWNQEIAEENWNKIVNAVDSTKGKIIVYEGKPIDAFFHANSGGTTEDVSNVWGNNNMPYLQSVETSGEDAYTQYSSEVEIKKDELLKKLKIKSNEKIDWNEFIKIIEYTNTGRVKTIKIGESTCSGTEIRSKLGLKSTNFKVEILDDSIKFIVIGYGHGVGMSQTGADSMAKNNKKSEEIIKHFYTGVEIIDVNDL